MTTPVTARGRATRQRLVEGAAAEFRRRGVAATTLDDVLAVTRTSKGQLFHYFPGGREELLLTVARHEADQVLTDQEPWLDRLATPADWLSWRDAVVRRYVRQGNECPLNTLMTQVGRDTPGAQAVTRELFQRWQERLTAGIERLQAAGNADPSLDSRRVAGAVVASIQGGVLVLLTTGEVGYLEAALDVSLAHLGITRQQTAAGQS
jgi:AcrR family transcriptional regulator